MLGAQRGFVAALLHAILSPDTDKHAGFGVIVLAQSRGKEDTTNDVMALQVSSCEWHVLLGPDFIGWSHMMILEFTGVGL